MRIPVDISAYADGAMHAVRFEPNTGHDVYFFNLHVDDVRIVDGDSIFANGFEPARR